MSGGDRDKVPFEGAAKLIYENALKREEQLSKLRLKAAEQTAAWQPPSADEFNNWFSPNDAVDGLTGRSIEDGTKKRWLLERLRAGAITGVARQAQIGSNPLSSFTPVPIQSWEHFNENATRFWEFGDATITIPLPLHSSAGGYGPTSTRKERYFDVRFHPEDFSGGARPRPIPAQPDAAEPPSEGAQAATNKGGRPPKPFWEDLLIEMFDQLWHGALTPQTQADIEKAMDSWLIANGHSASERSIRERARKLWKAWIKEGNN